MNANNVKLCAPAITYLAFTAAWIIYSTLSLNFFSVLYAIFAGILGVLGLEFLCRKLNPVVAWVLLAVPIVYMAVVAGLFAYTGTLTTLRSTISPTCHGSFCLKGDVSY